jgi:FAD/FMN-containing dehydrogenase
MSALKSLRKDNTGYDVKSLFIGAEGTLGVITAASLKLFPQPADTATALVGIDTPRHALKLLEALRSAAGDQLTTFELMPQLAVELTVRHVAAVADPLPMGTAWYLLAADRPLASGRRRGRGEGCPDRDLHGAIAGDVETARIGAGGSTAPRREPQARRLRADCPRARTHRGRLGAGSR